MFEAGPLAVHDALHAPAPVAFGGLFGWLHMPPPGAARDCGVVLCGPFGAAAVGTHRNWRRFAAMLAAAGFPTLRFDYPSTGDSADFAGEDLLGAWQRSISDAAAWLREAAGVEEVAFCGLRFGALLAALAAAEAPGRIKRLVLLAPVTEGRAYARELVVAGQAHGIIQPPCGGLEAEGLYLSPDQAALLRRLDLLPALQAAVPRDVLVLEAPWQMGTGSRLAAQAAATNVTSVAFADAEAFFGAAAMAPLPHMVFGAVVAWLKAGTPRNALARPEKATRAARLILPGGVRSAAFRFGENAGLFGIASLPPGPARGTAMLIVNSGAEPHTGHGRFAVLLARHLAARGIAAFRMDVTGFGDSSREAIEPEEGDYTAYERALLRVYRPEFVDDVVAALDELRHQGFSRYVIAGLCSGANLALHAALLDARVQGLVLINPTFTSRDRAAVPRRAAPAKGLRGWVRRRLDAAGFGAVRRNRLRAGWRQKLFFMRGHLARLFRLPALLDEKSRWLWRLRDRGVKMLTIASTGDDAIGAWGLYAAGLGLEPPVIMPGISHTFEPLGMRAALISLIGRFMMDRS